LNTNVKTTKNQHKSPGLSGGLFFMKPKQVSIQGYEGCFHQVAARYFFGRQVEVIPCATFKEVINTAATGHADAAVMAIENSIAGSILQNYQLLHRSGLTVCGEIYLQIRQHLLVNPGVKLEDIREVHSHTMALQQCFEYLDQHNWKLVETEDTALSAKLLRRHQSRHIAAIAGRLAADLYELEVLAPDIQTLKNNYTRFLVLKPDMANEIVIDANKASVRFHTDHTRGSLARVLTLIAGEGVNLSKLQSVPLPGSAFKYSFHADMEFETRSQFDAVIRAIRPETEDMHIYGVYKKGLWK